MSDPLLDAARAWQAQDPDPETRAEIEALIGLADLDELEHRFAGRLEFGTAGLRARIGAGPSRMNRATVRRATAGLMAHLEARGVSGPVVVGRDARTGSADFLDEAVAVVGGAGRTALVLPEPCPTPLCAFAVLDQGAAAGVVITASHNPPSDNGYKVYLDDGMQIAPPTDRLIAERIDAVDDLRAVPLDRSRRVSVDTGLVERYLAAVLACVVVPEARSTRVAYSPMHGVAGELTVQALELAGFPAPVTVGVQFEPDPTFPTVEFPNPEEPGAMDLVTGAARSHGCDLALANDPDGDRLGVVAPDGAGWRLLRGDEIGVLLADHLLNHGRRGPDDTVATTVVSSRLLLRLAEAHGVRAVETLPGFKWVARAAQAEHFLFGYEEALGYAIGGRVRDKDGISAAVVLSEAAAVLAARGQSLFDRLDDLALELGVHLTDQVAIRAGSETGMEDLRAALDSIRSAPPSRLGEHEVSSFEDFERGERLPPTNAICFEIAGGRVVLRPSGTEPKLKCYLEAVEPVLDGDLEAARVEAKNRLDELSRSVNDLLTDCTEH